MRDPGHQGIDIWNGLILALRGEDQTLMGSAISVGVWLLVLRERELRVDWQAL